MIPSLHPTLMSQTSIEQFAQFGVKPCLSFSSSRLLSALVNWIVADDQVIPFPCYYNKTSFLKPCAQSIYVVESPEFQAILLLCREAMTDKDIPHRMSVRGGIIKAWKVEFDALHKEMQVHCFTHTLAQPHKLNHFFFRMRWAESKTSGLTMVGVHMSHSPHTGLPAVEMARLNLVPACLVFTASMGHTGDRLCTALLHLLDRASITPKVSWPALFSTKV